MPQIHKKKVSDLMKGLKNASYGIEFAFDGKNEATKPRIREIFMTLFNFFPSLDRILILLRKTQFGSWIPTIPSWDF